MKLFLVSNEELMVQKSYKKKGLFGKKIGGDPANLPTLGEYHGVKLKGEGVFC